jgi:hypothetical protein
VAFGESDTRSKLIDPAIYACGDWFGVKHPPSERSIRDILAEWDFPEEISEYQRIEAAVAQILLERVQDRLP